MIVTVMMMIRMIVDEYGIDNYKMMIIIMFYLLLDMLMALYYYDSYGYDNDNYGYDGMMIVFI